MINQDSLYVILFSLPIYQILFYTVQLLSFKRINPSKKYLGLLLLSMTVFLVMTAVRLLGYTDTFSFMLVFYLPVLLSVAPSFFLYILSITRENHDVNKRQRTILFIPAIFILLVNLIILLVMDKTEMLAFIESGILGKGVYPGQFPFLMISWLAGIILVFFQIVFAVTRLIRIIQTEAEIMRQQPAHLAYLEWTWIIGISISVLVFLVINAVFEMIWPASNLGIAIVYNLLMLLSGGIAGYLGMKQDTLLNQVMKIDAPSGDPVLLESIPSQTHESKPSVVDFIDEKEIDLILRKLPDILEKGKPYMKPDFSLQELSEKLQMNRRKVSYVLNEVMGKNFYGLINEYRVKEAQKLLLAEEASQYKIETLGEMVGFQSKSSFNACFKKYTGLTPSEYKNQHMLGGVERRA